VKYHFKSNQGNKGLTPAQIREIEAKTLDYATEDLYVNIEKGNFPSWNLYVQVIPEKEGYEYKYDIFDVTKVWHHSDYPLIPVGRVVLNRNPENFFAESDQVAFAPTNLVPGIEPSPDKILQGRIFSYPDTQRHRLGANFEQLPINCPYRTKVCNYQRDGPARYDDNGKSAVNYEPNSLSHAVEDPKFVQHQFMLQGCAGRFKFQHPNCDYEQPRLLFRKVWNDEQRSHAINNFVCGLQCVRKDIKERMLNHLHKIDAELGKRVAEGIGMVGEQPRL